MAADTDVVDYLSSLYDEVGKNELAASLHRHTTSNMQSKRNISYSAFSSKAFPEFKVDAESFFPDVNILEDIVLKVVNEKEYEYTKFFSDRVLNGELLNFPIIYGQGEPFVDSEGVTKVVVALEKFDADYTSMMDEDTPIEEFISMVLQILMGLYAIDSFGKYHGDLNPGNILYKTITPEDEFDSENPGYLKYMVDGETYYIKHFNKLWVILDFQLTGDKGEVLPAVFDEIYLRRVFSEFYDLIEKPVRGTWLYDMFALTRFIGVTRMNERVFHLMQDKSTLNPFEAIPHLIKYDYSELLVHEE
jgi:hypothetical protein